jgi:triacylglycerol lipase
MKGVSIQRDIAYGSDSLQKLDVFGHSAGANHVADYAAHPEVRGAEASSVKGVILLSPAYSTSPGGRPNAYLWPGR